MNEKRDFATLVEQQESLRLQFIRSELDLAITFCELAGNTENRETADRNTENAKRAYEVVTHALSTGAALELADRQEVDGKLTQLEGMLARLERHEDTGKKAED